MKIQAKKALRAANERVAEAAQGLRDASGLAFEVRLDHEPALNYDLDAIRSDLPTVFEELARIPVNVLKVLQTIMEDEDYKEAYGEMKAIEFVPTPTGTDADFDYEQSASVHGETLRITFAPLEHNHGGYERSLQALF